MPEAAVPGVSPIRVDNRVKPKPSGENSDLIPKAVNSHLKATVLAGRRVEFEKCNVVLILIPRRLGIEAS